MEDISVQELKQRLDSGETFHFIDVRNPDEYDEQNLGATLIPVSYTHLTLPTICSV